MQRRYFYIILLFLLLSSCKGRLYKMVFLNMEPNVKVGCILLAKEDHSYAYGDIVAIEGMFEYPIIYRIVALSSDSIGIEDHICILNGTKFKTEFVKQDKDQQDLEVTQFVEKWTNGTNLMIWINKDPYGQEFANMSSIKVPENHVFVIGDYRAASVDSREFGAVPIEKIKGKVVKVIVK